MNLHNLIIETPLPCLGYRILEGFIDVYKEPQHNAAIDFYSVPRTQQLSLSDGLDCHKLKVRQLVTVSSMISSRQRLIITALGSEREMPKSISSPYSGFIKA